MNLLLVRHAKAEKIGADMELVRHGRWTEEDQELSDSIRELTEEGISEFKDSIFVIRDLLIGRKSIIWSSSKVRADQTAKIIGEALDIEDILYFDFLATGDFQELKKELSMNDEEKTIIAVGHEPFLTEWLMKILDLEIDIKKGQIISISLEGKNLEKSRLQWIKTPKKRIEYYEIPSINKGTVSADIKDLAFYYIQRIISIKENFIKNPGDTGATHQIRVSIRSLRSIISFIKSYFEANKYEGYQNVLREMAQKFLFIRQFDVIIKEWESIIKENEAYLEDGGVLLKLLKEERLKEERIVLEWLEKEDVLPVLSDILSWIKSFDEGLEKDEVEDFFEKRLGKYIDDINKGLVNLSGPNLEEIHSLRIKCKKARYIIENLEKTKKNIKLTKKYKRLQDDLGLICDTIVNKSFLNKLVKNNKIDGLEYQVGIFIGYQISQASNVLKKLM